MRNKKNINLKKTKIKYIIKRKKNPQKGTNRGKKEKIVKSCNKSIKCEKIYILKKNQKKKEEGKKHRNKNKK
jgi:hypothetical protein